MNSARAHCAERVVSSSLVSSSHHRLITISSSTYLRSRFWSCWSSLRSRAPPKIILFSRSTCQTHTFQRFVGQNDIAPTSQNLAFPCPVPPSPPTTHRRRHLSTTIAHRDLGAGKTFRLFRKSSQFITNLLPEAFQRTPPWILRHTTTQVLQNRCPAPVSPRERLSPQKAMGIPNRFNTRSWVSVERGCAAL